MVIAMDIRSKATTMLQMDINHLCAEPICNKMSQPINAKSCWRVTIPWLLPPIVTFCVSWQTAYVFMIYTCPTLFHSLFTHAILKKLVAESQGTVTGIDLSPASEHRGKLVMGEPFIRASHKWLSILVLLFSITYFFFALSNLFEMDKGTKNKSLKESLVGKSNRSGRCRSPKRVVTAPIVQITTQKDRKKPQQKKSIMKKSNFNDDDSQESAPYAIL